MPTAPSMKRRQTLVGQHPVATPEEMLERYEPLDVVGHGSFGLIRKVKRKADGLILARKELTYRSMSEKDLKQVNEEVMILQSMPPHENIVRYYERFIDKQEHKLHIIMEFCEGGDLGREIAKCRDANTVMPEDVVWLYLTQIAQALHDCHSETDSQGRRKAVVLHRDIKPENVFLSADGQVKLGDFGLSKAMSAAAFTQTYVGTPYYMSPELIHGFTYDSKSDIWALGCLIYELCAWRPPFHKAQSQDELCQMIRTQPIPDLPRYYSRLLDQMVKAMMRQEARSRPTARHILSHDRVATYAHRITLRKREQIVLDREAEINKRETALLLREKTLAQMQSKELELAQRERTILEREQQLLLHKQALDMEKAQVMHVLSQNPLEASCSSSSSEGLDDAASNNPRSHGFYSTASSCNNTDAEDVIRKVANRPSLVPRRHDSQASVGSLVRRMSSNSLLSLDDPPVRHQHSPLHHRAPSLVTLGASNSSGDSNRRRIHTSRSMYNLNNASKTPGVGRQLFPSYSRDSLRAFAQGQDSAVYSALPPSPMRETFFPASDSEANSEARSAPPPSPSKRSATTAFPSQSDSQARPVAAPRTNTAANLPVPQYDMTDEDSLPSPFIKKKVGRQPSRSSARVPPPVPSRTLRPSTSRLSLATKLAMGRTRSQTISQENQPPSTATVTRKASVAAK